VEQWERRLAPYFATGNERATRRLLLARITFMQQTDVPWAPELADTAEVVIRREGGGAETYRMDRLRTGTPLVAAGPLPQARGAVRAAAADPLVGLGNVTAPLDRTVVGIGSTAPVFRAPDGFALRMGARPGDLFYTGTYQAGGFRIGLLRIPRFSVPPNPNEEVELGRFLAELGFMLQATDGIVIDVMRNPGGQVQIVEGIAQVLMTRPFRTIGFQIRATQQWANRFEASVQAARASNAPQYVVDRLQRYLDNIRTAQAENRGLTGPLPIASDTLDLLPFALPDGTPFFYTKPIMVLTDEFSTSGADMFPAILRDNNRAILFGYRTGGAGGSVVTVPGGPYSEGLASVTQTLMARIDGRPIENAGVEPDIAYDYMTRENLTTQGRPFVEAFTAAMVEHIRRNR
jgi:hypothetical protein